jgi:hypothetical protein
MEKMKIQHPDQKMESLRKKHLGRQDMMLRAKNKIAGWQVGWVTEELAMQKVKFLIEDIAGLRSLCAVLSTLDP